MNYTLNFNILFVSLLHIMQCADNLVLPQSQSIIALGKDEKCFVCNSPIKKCKFQYIELLCNKSLGKKEKRNEILSQMIRRQNQNRYFNPKATHLEYRSQIVDWMQKIITKLEMSDMTFHISVLFLDSVLSMTSAEVEHLKLIAYICFFVAAKMEENESKIPLVEEALLIFENQFTRAEFENCECTIFQILQYNLNPVTPLHILQFFLSSGIVFSDDYIEQSEKDCHDFVKNFEQFCFKLLNDCIQRYEFYRYSSIAVAASVIATARIHFMFRECWNKKMEQLTLINFSDIEECTKYIINLFLKKNQKFDTPKRRTNSSSLLDEACLEINLEERTKNSTPNYKEATTL